MVSNLQRGDRIIVTRNKAMGAPVAVGDIVTVTSWNPFYSNVFYFKVDAEEYAHLTFAGVPQHFTSFETMVLEVKV